MERISIIDSFFEIDTNNDIGIQIFEILNKIINFRYGVIYFTRPKKILYSFGENNKNLQKISSDLKYKNTKFGEIVLKNDKFSSRDITILQTCSKIISNIIKDNEMSKIMKLQVEALQSGYKKIKQAEEVKSKFISHISHEFRTPLNAILGYTDLLENEFIGSLNNKQKEYLEDIKVSGLNLLGMINEILDISKIEANAVKLSKTKFEIQTLASEIENIIKPLFLQKNIEYETEIKNSFVFSDYQKLQTILFNLLSNAIKYTNAGGKVLLKAYAEDKKLHLIVKDTGIGIEKKFQKKIFQKFEQLNENVPNSTGLGLSVTKELVDVLGGTIKLESKKALGSTFIIEIPNIAI